MKSGRPRQEKVALRATPQDAPPEPAGLLAVAGVGDLDAGNDDEGDAFGREIDDYAIDFMPRSRVDALGREFARGLHAVHGVPTHAGIGGRPRERRVKLLIAGAEAQVRRSVGAQPLQRGGQRRRAHTLPRDEGLHPAERRMIGRLRAAAGSTSAGSPCR